MKKGKLIIISGPSGVGKGTVVKALMEQNPQMKLSVSATTRDRRPNEIDGVHYYFISHEAFEKMIAQNRFLEYAQYVGNRYGTPEEPVNKMLEAGYDVILEIEVQGGMQVMKRRPDAISIFVAPPSFTVLEERLRGRGDTEEDKILMRLQQARVEYFLAPYYQYIVVNDKLEDAVLDVQSILRVVDLKSENQQHLLKEAL